MFFVLAWVNTNRSIQKAIESQERINVSQITLWNDVNIRNLNKWNVEGKRGRLRPRLSSSHQVKEKAGIASLTGYALTRDALITEENKNNKNNN